MSNTSLPSAFSHPITEDDIANYLANTPDFFERHAQLLASVQLYSPHSARAVSLQERQASLFRDRIKQLEQRVMEMVRNVNDNMVMLDKLLQWARALFLHAEARTLPELLASDLAERFAVPQVGIRVWGVAAAYADAAFAQDVGEEARGLASALTEPYCGLNTDPAALSWLPDPKAAVSLAILPLRGALADNLAPTFGMLVLASPDPQRFNSSMGTDFLSRLAELASAALTPLR